MKKAYKIFRRSFYDVYLHLGLVFWSSVIWFLGALTILLSGPVTGALFYTIKLKRTGHDVGLRDFWFGFVKYGKPSFILGLVYLIITIPSSFYIFFFFSFETLLSKVIGLILVYLLILWHLLYIYLFPIMVEQEIFQISELLKRSIKIVSENLLFSTSLLLLMMFITFISSIIPLLLVTIWAGWMAFVAYNALIYILSKYDPDRYQLDVKVNWRGIWKIWRE